MLHNIPEDIKKRMEYLEERDRQDRVDETPRMKRLRQIPPETGKLLSILASCAPNGEFLEIGTSAGYSTLWIALACQAINRTITTFEILKEKANLARETIQLTKLEKTIKLIEGDARSYLSNYPNISFCFLDAEKEIYDEC
jgi:predicted O-methyltransferase YrrM